MADCAGSQIVGLAAAKGWSASRGLYQGTPRPSALAAVLLFGILQGILLAALVSVLIMLILASRPHVAFLGRVPGTTLYSDITRHPENEPIPGMLVFRPDGSLLYVNAENVLEAVLAHLASQPPSSVRLVGLRMGLDKSLSR